MSQIALTYILSQAQLEELNSRVEAGDENPWSDYPELEPDFGYSGSVMMVLEAFADQTLEEEIESPSPQVDYLREKEHAVWLAFHHRDVPRAIQQLTTLEQDPERLGEFYEEFYEETFDEETFNRLSEAMLNAIRYLKMGLKQLSAEQCWLLVLIS